MMRLGVWPSRHLGVAGVWMGAARLGVGLSVHASRDLLQRRQEVPDFGGDVRDPLPNLIQVLEVLVPVKDPVDESALLREQHERGRRHTKRAEHALVQNWCVTKQVHGSSPKRTFLG